MEFTAEDQAGGFSQNSAQGAPQVRPPPSDRWMAEAGRSGASGWLGRAVCVEEEGRGEAGWVARWVAGGGLGPGPQRTSRRYSPSRGHSGLASWCGRVWAFFLQKLKANLACEGRCSRQGREVTPGHQDTAAGSAVTSCRAACLLLQNRTPFSAALPRNAANLISVNNCPMTKAGTKN